MDDDLTQPSTQPFFDPRRQGRSGELGPEDGSDIIMTLHPTTPAAIEAITTCAEHCPQHIFQGAGFKTLPRDVDDDDDMDMAATNADPPELGNTQFVQPQSRFANTSDSGDLALRISSKVRDAKLGWVFGRDKKKCDILLQAPDERRAIRVSGMHFRIYVTNDGVIMLEDMSTNGTYVDEILLRRGNPTHSRRSLDNGSMISVTVRTERLTQGVTRATFMARFPSRSGSIAEIYANKLQAYISARAGPSATPSHSLIGLGGFRSNYGMKWDGGEKYGVVGVVGKGAFATVYKLVDKSIGTVYAAKEIDKIKFMKNGELDTKFGNELRIIKSLNHPHIVKYCDYQEERDHLYIMMEYVGYGDMSEFMNQCDDITEDLCRSVARQLCQALKYIHDEGVTHRDIKPDNILIAKKTPMVVKLTDFGLSKLADGPDTAAMKTFCGTLLYCAPEVYPSFARLRASNFAKRQHGSQIDENGERIGKAPSTYSRKVDIWSVAAVLFHMLTGEPPYMGTAENQGEMMLRNILSHKLDLSPLETKKVSAECVSFIDNLMKVDPAHRPTAAATLLHPWLEKEPDVEDIPLCRSEIEAKLVAAVKEQDIAPAYESDFEETGFSSRVAELDSQTVAGRPLDINKELSSDEEVVFESKAPRPQPPLFGEVRETGLPDSGIFGNGQQPPISQPPPQQNGHLPNGCSVASSDASSRSVSALKQPEATTNGSVFLHIKNGGGEDGVMEDLGGQDAVSSDGVHSTTSQLNHLDVDDNLEDLQYEKPNEDDDDNNILEAHSPGEESSAPSLLSTMASGLKRTRQVNDDLTVSKRVAMLDRSHAEPSNGHDPELLGVLKATSGSIDHTTIEIRDRLIMWGRAPRNTHQYKNPMDSRVPKMGLDIVFWRPGMDEAINSGEEWTDMSEIDALIFTRATHGIKVNGMHLKTGTKELLCGKLRTGDIIEIFSDLKTGEYLRFECEFYHGNSAAFRKDDDPFTVESNEELYVVATKSRSQDQ